MIPRFSMFFGVLICMGFTVSFAQHAQKAEIAAEPSQNYPVLKSVDVTHHANHLAIEISLSAPFVPHAVQLIGPDRLVLDFPGYELQNSRQRIPVNDGPVRDLRLSLFQALPPVTRVVIDSKEPLNFELEFAENKIVIEIAFSAATPLSATSSLPSKKIEQPPATNDAEQNQPQQNIATPSAGSKATAYTLQAKAKTLRLEDLPALEDKAAQGDPEAQTVLALAYHEAVLLKKNDAESLRLLHQAASQNFMAAEESLGIFAQAGFGTPQPAPAEALDWYKKAVQQGSLDAATSIALMYAEGAGMPKDAGQALTWFLQAAGGGDATAQYNLALMYGRGNRVTQDYKEFVRWLTAAADQNVVPAILDLAAFYMRPRDGTSSDVEKAVHYYQRAAGLGSARAQVLLGDIFVTGAQGKPDYEQAAKWYRKAADQGDRNAQFGLGVLYALGQGVPVDPQEARRLFTAAADDGQPDAQYDLATMWEESKDAPADPELAEHYYQLAAEQGIPKAQFRLGQLLARKGEYGSNRVSAYKWLMLAQSSIRESSPALNDLRKLMSPQEIAEAEHAVDDWRKAHREDHLSK